MDLFANEKETDHIFELSFLKDVGKFSAIISVGYFQSNISQSSLWPDVEIVDGEYEWDPVRLISQGHSTVQDFIVLGGGLRKSFELTKKLTIAPQMKITAFFKPSGSSERTVRVSDQNGDTERYGIGYTQTIRIERALTPFLDLSTALSYDLSSSWSIFGNAGYRVSAFESYVTSIHNYTIFDGRTGQSVNQKRGDGFIWSFGLSRSFGK